MSQFCSWDEAFAGPVMPPPGGKKKKTSRSGTTKEPAGQVVEMFAPGPLPGAPEMGERMAHAPEVLRGPPPSMGGGKLDEGVNIQDFFPLPGETAEPEEWAKAFTLAPSSMPAPQRPDGAISVIGKPTLWRNIPEPPVPMPSASTDQLAVVPSDINQRLDMLTRQLESLTTPTPLQSTAELFLFVAIGLLILLFIDTILRFATNMAAQKMMTGGGSIGARGGSYRMGGGGWGSRRWR